MTKYSDSDLVPYNPYSVHPYMVKLEEKKTVLTQIKKAFETLVANFDKGDEARSSFWGQSNYGGRHSRRDDYDKRFGEDE